MNMFRENYKNATVFYVMHSKYLDKVKIGITKNLDSRYKSLNSHKLGGAIDFRIVTSVNLGGDAGPFETRMLQELQNYVVPTAYESKSERTTSKELLDVNIEQVIRAGEKLLKAYAPAKICEFISCRDLHRSDLWANLPETRALQDMKRNYQPPMRMSKLATLIWERHGVIPVRESVTYQLQKVA